MEGSLGALASVSLWPLWVDSQASDELAGPVVWKKELVMEQRVRVLKNTLSHHEDPQRGMAPASLTPASQNLVQVLLGNSNQDIQEREFWDM